MDQYKYLDEEIKAQNNTKKKYTKLANLCLGTEFFLIAFELGLTGSTIAVPVITPISAPIVVALTTCSEVLKSIGNLIAKKTSKHSEIELLAKSKLDSLEEKFNKAINDEEITDDEFFNMLQGIKNYEGMKQSIQNKYKFVGLNINKRND
jgi:hypothetical protein